MKEKIYIAAFVLACLLPSAWMVGAGPSPAVANEGQSPPPALLTDEGKPNITVLEQAATYYNRHFGARPQLIEIQHRLDAALFRQSGAPQVILGQDGFLFYAQTADDFQDTAPMSERQLWSAARAVYLMQEYAENQGAQFLLMLVPNKNTLYGGYMPPQYKAAKTHDLTRLQAALTAQQVQYIDLEAAFSAQPDLLYRREDSHWTTRGAGLAADMILDALSLPHERYFGTAYQAVETEAGDLAKMLYPASAPPGQDEIYNRQTTFSYVRPVRSTEDIQIDTVQEKAEGSLLMFRDSFGNALHPLLAEWVGTARFSRLNPYRLDFLAEGYDRLVIQQTERRLDWLYTRPAVFAAPLRLAPQATASTQTISLMAEEQSALAGYALVSGNLSNTLCAADSSVLLHFGEYTVEASPAGEGDYAFSAYVPQDWLRLPTAITVWRERAFYRHQAEIDTNIT